MLLRCKIRQRCFSLEQDLNLTNFFSLYKKNPPFCLSVNFDWIDSTDNLFFLLHHCLLKRNRFMKYMFRWTQIIALAVYDESNLLNSNSAMRFGVKQWHALILSVTLLLNNGYFHHVVTSNTQVSNHSLTSARDFCGGISLQSVIFCNVGFFCICLCYEFSVYWGSFQDAKEAWFRHQYIDETFHCEAVDAIFWSETKPV